MPSFDVHSDQCSSEQEFPGFLECIDHDACRSAGIASGLLHGSGFAGALRDIGLPQGDVPLALFAFNLGVEFGQLVFIAAVSGIIFVARRIALPPVLQQRVRPAAAYVIGTLAAFWFFERLAGFWP